MQVGKEKNPSFFLTWTLQRFFIYRQSPVAENLGRFYLSTVRCAVKRNTSSRRRRQLHPSSSALQITPWQASVMERQRNETTSQASQNVFREDVKKSLRLLSEERLRRVKWRLASSLFFCPNRIFFHDELFLSCKTIQCEQCCIANGKTLIFHLLIILSVSEVLHICESKCFILWNDSGTMLHLKRRFMKHACRRMKRHCVPWSAPSVHETKPFQASCFFAPSGQKNGTPDRNRTCDQLLRRQLLYPLSYWGNSIR